jgi:hypothetical protein
LPRLYFLLRLDALARRDGHRRPDFRRAHSGLSARFASELIRATTSPGVPAGAKMAYQETGMQNFIIITSRRGRS